MVEGFALFASFGTACIWGMSTTNLESDAVGATSDETKELSHFQDDNAVVDLVSDIKPEKSSEDADGSGVMRRNVERRRRQSRSSSGSLRGSVLYAANAAKDLAHASVLKPTLLGPTQCSAIIVNYISTGYILLPYGEYQCRSGRLHHQSLAATSKSISHHLQCSLLFSWDFIFCNRICCSSITELHFVDIHS